MSATISAARRGSGRFRKHWPLLLMTLPGCAYLIVNNYIPGLFLFIAFKDIKFSKGFLGSDWCGLENFKFLVRSPDFWLVTRNTIAYNLSFLLVNTVFAVMIAIFLAEIRNKFLLRAYQSLIMLPHLISMVIVSYIAYAFLSTETGVLNRLIAGLLGGRNISWYAKAEYWPAILTIVNLWHKAGYLTIIYLASILGIDRELYESAQIDGASKIRQILHITIPGIKQTIVVMALLSLGKIFSSDFGLFYQVPMNSGMLYKTTNVLSTYIYRAFLVDSNVGMSSAASLYQSLVGFILVITSNAVIRKVDRESALF